MKIKCPWVIPTGVATLEILILFYIKKTGYPLTADYIHLTPNS